MGGPCNTFGGGERRSAYRVLVGDLNERDHLEKASVEGRIIQKWISRKWDGVAWNGLIWLRIGTGGEHL